MFVAGAKDYSEAIMSRVNFGPQHYLYPMPVLIIGTYDENGRPDAMNAAWGSITDDHEISISLGHHKTTENLELSGAFTVSVGTEETAVACDYVGLVSGKNEPQKFEKAGFHATKSAFVNAPLIDELPMTLECRVKSFIDGILIGEIVNVTADERILTNGKIDPKKLKPISYDTIHKVYRSLGDPVASAYCDGLQLK